jgi:thymidylate synthase ThyX
MITARVELDSVSPEGKRLTTFVLEYPKFIHGELMTHRVLSRNASSSRAIPVEKMLKRVREQPAEFVFWGKNQKGMQADVELEGEELERARACWYAGAQEAANRAEALAAAGLHKQSANRALEPYCHIAVIVSMTEPENLYALRTDRMAQPEFQHLAKLMLAAQNASTPVLRYAGEWHLPFITRQEHGAYSVVTLCKMSVARCARVSYWNHDGKPPDPSEECARHDSLLAAGHVSPFEHQAQAPSARDAKCWFGNFQGWDQYRKRLPNEVRSFDGLKPVDMAAARAMREAERALIIATLEASKRADP